MKDIHRVYALWFIACAPFLLVMFVGIILYSPPPRTVSDWWVVLAMCTAFFGGIIFWKSSRLRHYDKTFAEHEENYRYEKKKVERLDLSDTKMGDVDPFVCDYIIHALEPVIKHLQTANIMELDHTFLVNRAREKLRPVAENLQSIVDSFTRMSIPEIQEEAQ